MNILRGQSLKGIAASQGIGVGPVIVYQPSDLTIPERLPEGVEVELSRFRNAC